jgi:ATP-dependent Clp protease adapter protein ClpS
MSEKRAGYFQFLTIRGVPLFVHWSFPVSGFFVSAFTGSTLREVAFFSLGYVLVVAIHEGGHFVAARLSGLRVFAIEISGMGGTCRVERPHRVRQSVVIYSAGLIAQSVLFLLTQFYLAMCGFPAHPLGQCLVISFTVVNAILLVLNLIPQKASKGLSTDGYVLWRLILHVVSNRPHPHPQVASPAQATVFSPQTRLLSIPALVPPGFTQGIEILNDQTTSMEFVVTSLIRHLELDRQEAIEKMLDIHNKGGLLVQLSTVERAEQVAAVITSEAKEQGYSLICRTVDTRQSAPASSGYP